MQFICLSIFRVSTTAESFFAECILVLLLNKVKEIFGQYDNRKNKDNIMFNSI